METGKQPVVLPPGEGNPPKQQDLEIHPNPNPAANENLDAAPGVENGDTVGVGSEVTDGEDG